MMNCTIYDLIFLGTLLAYYYVYAKHSQLNSDIRQAYEELMIKSKQIIFDNFRLFANRSTQTSLISYCIHLKKSGHFRHDKTGSDLFNYFLRKTNSSDSLLELIDAMSSIRSLTKLDGGDETHLREAQQKIQAKIANMLRSKPDWLSVLFIYASAPQIEHRLLNPLITPILNHSFNNEFEPGSSSNKDEKLIALLTIVSDRRQLYREAFEAPMSFFDVFFNNPNNFLTCQVTSAHEAKQKFKAALLVLSNRDYARKLFVHTLTPNLDDLLRRQPNLVTVNLLLALIDPLLMFAYFYVSNFPSEYKKILQSIYACTIQKLNEYKHVRGNAELDLIKRLVNFMSSLAQKKLVKFVEGPIWSRFAHWGSNKSP